VKNQKKIKFFIIIKSQSVRIKNKNFKKLNNLELYRHLLSELKNEKIYIDTDSNKILKISKKDQLLKNFKVYKRDKKFVDLENSNDFKLSPALLMIENFIDKYCSDEDIIVTTHVTSPFIKKNTIFKAIEYLSKGYDSVSSVTINREFALIKKGVNYKRINFKEKIINKTQDLNPIVLLNGSFFIFKAKTFKKYKSRYSKKHYYYEINYPESIDINYPEDLIQAKDYLNSKKNNKLKK
tara:strand:+ start:273 stop:986 length:714 start_codon:yes stop_codon:yes gene_type:complete